MGKFQPGQINNPNGRPKGSGKSPKIRELLEEHVPKAVAALVAALSDDDGRVAVQAAKEILTRVYGVPVQALPDDGGDKATAPQRPIYRELKHGEPTPADLRPPDESEVH